MIAHGDYIYASFHRRGILKIADYWWLIKHRYLEPWLINGSIPMCNPMCWRHMCHYLFIHLFIYQSIYSFINSFICSSCEMNKNCMIIVANWAMCSTHFMLLFLCVLILHFETRTLRLFLLGIKYQLRPLASHA